MKKKLKAVKAHPTVAETPEDKSAASKKIALLEAKKFPTVTAPESWRKSEPRVVAAAFGKILKKIDGSKQ